MYVYEHTCIYSTELNQFMVSHLLLTNLPACKGMVKEYSLCDFFHPLPTLSWCRVFPGTSLASVPTFLFCSLSCCLPFLLVLID